MRSFLTHRRALAIAVALLLLSCILPDRYGFAVARLPAAAVEMVAHPLRWPLALISGTLRGSGDEAPPLHMTEPELREQVGYALVLIAQLQQRLSAAEERLALFTQAREIALIGATEVEARVTGVGGDATRPALLIDKGASRGITIDAPVVSGVNLVGRVKTVSPANARVELTVSAGARLFVKISPPTAQAGPREVHEQIRRSEDGPWFEAKVEIKSPVEVGDWAHLADDLWPPEAQGFVVGQVVRIEEDPTNPLQFKQLIIEPMQDLTRLRRVIVRVPVR